MGPLLHLEQRQEKLQCLFVLLDQALKLAAERNFFYGRHPIHQQHPVQMIKLVLNGPREQPFSVNLFAMAIQIGVFCIHFIPALNVGKDVRETQATFRTDPKISRTFDTSCFFQSEIWFG